MKVAYVSMPYGSPTAYGVDENIRRAKEIAVALWRQGWAVICPHANTEHFDGAVFPDDAEADRMVWIQGDLAILDCLDPERTVLVNGPGWRSSRGSVLERSAAINNGIPTFEWPEDSGRLSTLAAEYFVLPEPGDAPDD